MALVPPPEFAVDTKVDTGVAFEVVRPLHPKPAPESKVRNVLDVSLFVGLLGAGCWLIYLSQNRTPAPGEDIGPILFNAGLTPFLLSAWALLTGWGIKHREHAIKVLAGGLVLVVGLFLRQVKDTRELLMVLGPALFEIGALFFITKMFFLGEDDEKTIKDLMTELDEARASPGTGMALSYFYNFVLPTAAHINARGEAPSVVDAELEPKRPQPIPLRRNEMLIFIPRDIGLESDLKAAIRNAVSDRILIQAKPQIKAGVPATHRPMFLYCLSTDEKTAAHLCDIPTIITASADRAKDKYQQLRVDVARDIRDFQNRLLELVRSHPETKGLVSLLSVPPFPLELTALERIATQRDEAGPAPVQESAAEGEGDGLRRRR